MNKVPPSTLASMPPQVARLTVTQKRDLNIKLAEYSAYGSAITTPFVQQLANALFGVVISTRVTDTLMTQYGYLAATSDELVPTISGAAVAERVWVAPPTARHFTQTDKAQALADRMKIMADAFVEDILGDPFVQFADVKDAAIEASRAFGIALGAAVNTKARFGAPKILPLCAETASMAIRSSVKN